MYILSTCTVNLLWWWNERISSHTYHNTDVPNFHTLSKGTLRMPPPRKFGAWEGPSRGWWWLIPSFSVSCTSHRTANGEPGTIGEAFCCKADPGGLVVCHVCVCVWFWGNVWKCIIHIYLYLYTYKSYIDFICICTYLFSKSLWINVILDSWPYRLSIFLWLGCAEKGICIFLT